VGLFFDIPLRGQEKVVILQAVGRGQRNEKPVDYQDVRGGLWHVPPVITQTSPSFRRGFPFPVFSRTPQHEAVIFAPSPHGGFDPPSFVL